MGFKMLKIKETAVVICVFIFFILIFLLQVMQVFFF